MSSLHNFADVLARLRCHDWHEKPLVRIQGAQKAGKTRVASELRRYLDPSSQIIRIDCKSVTTVDGLLERVVACDTRAIFTSTRRSISGAVPEVLISNSVFTGSSVVIKRGYWPFRKRKPQRPAEPPSRVGLAVSVLSEDIFAATAFTWLIVDHAESAADEIKRVIDHLCVGSDGLSKFRMVLITTGPPHEEAGHEVADSIEFESFEIGRISFSSMLDWTHAIGLELSDERADMLYALSDGYAGRIWSNMKSYQARQIISVAGRVTEANDE